MSPGYRVRPMSEFDLPAVMELERALFPGDAWSEDMMRSELAESTRHYYVACRSGGAAGEDGPVMAYAGLRAVPPDGDVQTIAVDRSWWGRGVASALLTELLGAAYTRGVREVLLEVRSDNPRAKELYRRFMFTEIGVRRGYYRDGVDAIVMRCSAPAAAIARTRGGEPSEALEFGEPVEGAGEDEEKA
ncbi:ribosomal protein S18-alanine N-acetyltransferase [Streptomonospora litoralis]|uniref:Ribosomal-protein-alanine N-acetyltransferase n=1 Tax=Streptomonospora litoralis TaxID=2498135 RepID=A0A4P6Q0X1_9ACTN|nr:ribosomal protein S18-alanine N-acetyltransferase [Streptomonospora litoralis]QBI52354.1 ribosomal-protein-alanine N-acetyltransferase [Streptomonospora litoralis]